MSDSALSEIPRPGFGFVWPQLFAHLDKRLFGSTSKVIIDWFSGGFCLLL